jgi:hypothetical protein
MFANNSKFSKKTSILIVALMVVVLASITTIVAYAANPFITNRFVADPSVHVFNGRVYMYNTDDETNNGSSWNSKNWRAYSSTDLVNWTDHGQVFAVGSGGFTWASNFAWAPAAAQRNGFYYLYLPADTSKIGVARSTSPTSGFSDPRGNPLIQEGRDANAGTEVIDPMVFIDDDGQAYLYYGGLNVAKVVRLNSDMISLNGSIQTLSVSNYAEAPWVHKRNGTYYLSYSTGWPGQIGYSTSNSPMGPFTWRGIALDFVNTNTNHQAVVNYNNQWFMFYHKGARPGWSNYRRSPQIDCLFYNSDNTIRMVVQTTGGVTSSSCGGSNPTPTRTPTPGGPTPTRTPTPGAGTTYTIRNRNSNKCLEVAGSSTADGGNVQQFACNGGNNQRWRVIDLGSGYSRIENVNSGKVLDVNGCGTADGTNIQQWAWLNNNCQQWQLTTTASPWFRLVNRNSSKVADVINCSTADAANVRQWTWLNNNCQQWQLVP